MKKPEWDILNVFPIRVNLLSEGGILDLLSQEISCQSGADVAMTRESPDGTYLVYFPFGLLTEASQMRRYHKKFLVRSREMWYIAK